MGLLSSLYSNVPDQMAPKDYLVNAYKLQVYKAQFGTQNIHY